MDMSRVLVIGCDVLFFGAGALVVLEDPTNPAMGIAIMVIAVIAVVIQLTLAKPKGRGVNQK